MTARRSRTSSRAARSPSGSAARGCSARSSARTTTNWAPAARKNVGAGPDAGGPERASAYTFVGGSNLMMFKSSQEQERGLGGHQVPLAGPGPDRLREADPGHVPGARGAAEDATASPTAPTTRRSSRRSSRAGRTRRSRSGRQIENAYKGRFGNILDEAASGQGRPYSPERPEAARRSGQGGRRPAGPVSRLMSTLLRTGGACRRPARPCCTMSTITPTEPRAHRAGRSPSRGAAARSSLKRIAAPADHRPDRARRRLHGARAPAADGRRRLPLVQEPQHVHVLAAVRRAVGRARQLPRRSSSTPTTRCAAASWAPSRTRAVYTFWTVTGTLGGGLARGAAAQPADARAARSIRTLMLTPWIVPSFVVAVLWQFMWQSDVGIINKVLVDYTGAPRRSARCG